MKPNFYLDSPTRIQRRKTPGRAGTSGRKTPTSRRFRRTDECPWRNDEHPRLTVIPYEETVYNPAGNRLTKKGYALASDFRGNQFYHTRKLFGTRKHAADYSSRVFKTRPVGGMQKRYVYRRDE